ncbi:MAG: fumarate hydratase class I anaerobic [bacterium]|nr:MAG: fumarate hydratase class I anaerobic [bacterium]KAF0148471.1 MAG: fumarate hydratase class I anaerobic [bacterium]KAF0168015.1 MAG: fumarate hydratase class I anaerobic [bacterium]TXT21240.1 MAG: fumarate hydratase class I anaerobic [bacterium]
MTTIRQEDFIQSIADALQYISIYHPLDFVRAMTAAYEAEASPAAKDAMAQILVNSRLCAEGHRPICQDTGMVVAFLKIGMEVKWEGSLSIHDMINEGVRRAYTHPDNPLRASVLSDPAGARKNTRDNTPAVIYLDLVPGDTVDVKIAAKGGGSENKARFAVLNPSDSLVDWVLEQLPEMGAGWCPPGILGIGIGGTPEKALLMAKEALLDPIDIQDLKARGPRNKVEELRLELLDKVNALGIGAQGLGGLTTVLDVKIKDYPTHAASLPVGLIPNCAATRHIHFSLDGSGPAVFTPPPLSAWPEIAMQGPATARRVNLDTLTRAETATWKAGEQLLLTGKLLTGRDAAHKKLADLVKNGQPLPVDFRNRFIYYVGPVDPIAGEAVGPAGPTTATRMDKFTDLMLGDQVGLIGMVGKSERGPEAIASIRAHGGVYCIAVGGAAYLVAKAVKAARVLAFPELGMEAIYEFDVENMPVTVAVDSAGNSVHDTGPREWRMKIGRIPLAAH